MPAKLLLWLCLASLTLDAIAAPISEQQHALVADDVIDNDHFKIDPSTLDASDLEVYKAAMAEAEVHEEQRMSHRQRVICNIMCPRWERANRCSQMPQCQSCPWTSCPSLFAAHRLSPPAPPSQPLPATMTRTSYKPTMPSTRPATPAEFWTGGFPEALIGHTFTSNGRGQCPPWLPGYAVRRGPGGCGWDSVAMAVRFMRPVNRCGPGGVCHGPNSPTAASSVAGAPPAAAHMYDTCVNYNKGRFYPDYSEAGVCITATATSGNRHGLAYVEKTIAVNGIPGGGSWTSPNIRTNVNYFYEQSMRWAQTDAPARLTCDSFCKRCDHPLDYCPDTLTSPIATGEHGTCDCFCREGTLAKDFDRCTTVQDNLCTDNVYCGGHGSAAFRPTVAADEGTCSCQCAPGWSGRNCEIQDGTPCDINDCYHHTMYGDPTTQYGNFGGTRPNCQCTCSPAPNSQGGDHFNFQGVAGPVPRRDQCWRGYFHRRSTVFNSTSTDFTIQWLSGAPVPSPTFSAASSSAPLPSTHLRNNNGTDCLSQCNGRAGACPGYCGTTGACCRQGSSGPGQGVSWTSNAGWNRRFPNAVQLAPARLRPNGAWSTCRKPSGGGGPKDEDEDEHEDEEESEEMLAM